MFYLDSFLHMLSMGIAFILGAIIGAVVGYLSYDHALKADAKKKRERRFGDRRWKTIGKDSRIEEEQRRTVHHALAEIRAPLLDTAGVVLENEEIKFSAQLINVSKRGLGIIAQNFVKKGLAVYVSCEGEKLHIESRRAQVRNITLLDYGMRIGLQFFEPLEDL